MKNRKIYWLIALTVLFVINTIIVIIGASSAFDQAVRDLVMLIYSEATTTFMKVITFLGSTKFIIALICLIFVIFIIKKCNNKAYSVASLLIASTIINGVIKIIIRRPRPEYITVIEHSYAYPSGHTMAAATLYGFLIYLLWQGNLNKKNRTLYSVLLGILILLIGMSRIYLGAHFATDVLGGLLLSAIILIAFSLADQKYNIIKK